MTFHHLWRPARHRWLLYALAVLILGTQGLSANAVNSSDTAPSLKEAAATTAIVPQPAALPEKQVIPAVDGIPPGSTAEALPNNLPGAGIIDPNSAQNSGDPGVLVPLAQAQSGINHWMDAVDAAGPATPLSDPMFEGTIFVPSDAAMEASYPRLKLDGGSDVFSNVKPSRVAAQLNSLTVPGPPLRLDQLSAGQLLQTADDGLLKVVSVSPETGTATLQHLPSGLTLSIIEANLQSGNAIAHVVDAVPPPAATATAAAAVTERADVADPGGRYESAMTVLRDPVQRLGAFATMVEQAGLTDLLANNDTELTLFAPSDQAMQQFLQNLPPASQRALATNDSLADELVSGHLVAGVALGSEALQALLPEGQLESQAGAVLLVQERTGTGVPTYTPAAAGAPPTDGQVIVESSAAPTTTLTIDGAAISSPDIVGGRAVVHIIDKVLVPPDLAQQLHVPTTSIAPQTKKQPQSGVKAVSAAEGMRQPELRAYQVFAALSALWMVARVV